MGKSAIGLNNLPVGKWAVVECVLPEGALRRRLMDLGFVPGARVEALRNSPLGDPRAYKIRGAVIALRKEEAAKILVVCEEEWNNGFDPPILWKRSGGGKTC